MTKYAVRRLFLIVPTMLGVSVLVFALMRFVPGDVVDVMIGSDVVMSPAEREILRSMFGLDTNLRLENILGTCNASMLSMQIFDTYILDHKGSDEIVNAFGTREKEHTTWATAIFTLPYRSDTIKGQLVAVQDRHPRGLRKDDDRHPLLQAHGPPFQHRF